MSFLPSLPIPFRKRAPAGCSGGLFALSTLLILLFLFVLQVDVAAGAVSALGVPLHVRRIYSIQRFVNVSYAWVCVGLYVFGTFLAIFASAGLVPSILEPGRIALLLSKPIGRTILLLGRYFGTLLIVALNTVYMVPASGSSSPTKPTFANIIFCSPSRS